MQYTGDPSRQAEEAAKAAQKGADSIISLYDSMNDKKSFHNQHKFQTTNRKFSLKNAHTQQGADELGGYYVNKANVPLPEDFARQVTDSYVSPLNQTDAGEGYQTTMKWARPAGDMIKGFGSSWSAAGFGSSARQTFMNSIDDKLVEDHFMKFGGDKRKELIDAYHNASSMQEKQGIIDRFNEKHQSIIDSRLSGNKNLGITGYNQQYLEAGRFGRHKVARAQRKDKELKNAQDAIIHTRTDEIRTMHTYHTDYILDGESVHFHTSKTLDKAINQVVGYLNEDGVNVESMSMRQIDKALKTGMLNGVPLDPKKRAELTEYKLLKKKQGNLENAKHSVKQGVSVAPKMVVRETLGNTDAGKGYRIAHAAVKTGEIATSAALTGLDGVVTASAGIVRNGAKAYEFAYKKTMNGLIKNGDPGKSAKRRYRLDSHKDWTEKVKKFDKNFSAKKDALSKKRKDTTQFLNGSSSDKVKIIAKKTKKVTVKTAKGIDALSEKIFKKKLSDTKAISKMLNMRAAAIKRLGIMRQKMADSFMGKALKKIAEKIASMLNIFSMVKKVVIISFCAFILISASAFTVVASSVTISSMPGATAEDDEFLQSVVRDMQARQQQYENYILYGENTGGIDTSVVRCNAILVNGVERSDIDTSNGLAKAKIPVSFSADTTITETTTTYDYTYTDIYNDYDEIIPGTETVQKTHQHKEGEKNAVCEQAGADHSGCSVCKNYERTKATYDRLNKEQGTNKPYPKIKAHSCTYSTTEDSTTKIPHHDYVRTDKSYTSNTTTTTTTLTRTVHGYANSDGLNALGMRQSVPDGGTLSDAHVDDCETSVTYQYTDSNGQLQFVDEDGGVHVYSQADLYKAILSMATVALNNDCSNKEFYEQYCFKLLDSVYSAGYTVDYNVEENYETSEVQWIDDTPITEYESGQNDHGDTIWETRRTQENKDLSANSYRANVIVTIYLDSGLPDIVNKDTTDNAWMRLNGYRGDEYAPNIEDDESCYPTYSGLKVTGYTDASGNRIDLNDSTKFANFWEGWKNPDGSFNDNYDSALEWYLMDNEDWQDFNVILPGTYQYGTLMPTNATSKLEVAMYLRQCGFSNAGAAGIMGNLDTENGNWDPTENSGGSFGLAQWMGGRITNLFNYCSANGLDPYSVGGQIQFLVYEMQYECPAIIEYLKTTDDPEMAAQEFCVGFERCVGSTGHADKDAQYTGNIYPTRKGKIYQHLKLRMDNARNNYETIFSNIDFSGTGSEVVMYACQFLGHPYVWGGTDLINGTDCSGFVMRVYEYFGISLPRTSAEQRNVGIEVPSLAEARPGDIICYYGHVAIYMGNNQIVHASNPTDGIKISNRADYRQIASIRRVLN